jgi:hypothetical protein
VSADLDDTGQGLTGLTTATFEKFFQISDKNPIIGAGSRVGLLNKLGSSLLSLPDIFGQTGRPGCLVGMSSIIPPSLCNSSDCFV